MPAASPLPESLWFPKLCLPETTGYKDNHFHDKLGSELRTFSDGGHTTRCLVYGNRADQHWTHVTLRVPHTSSYGTVRRGSGLSLPKGLTLTASALYSSSPSGAESASGIGHTLFSISCWKIRSCSRRINSTSWLDFLTWKRQKVKHRMSQSAFRIKDQTSYGECQAGPCLLPPPPPTPPNGSSGPSVTSSPRP